LISFIIMFTQKKILAFSNAACSNCAAIIFFAAFLVKQKLIENEMEERLETASLQTITVNSTHVQWLKKNKEVLINGNLFDVHTYTTKGNTVILTGLYDKDEDQLHEQLKDFMQQKNWHFISAACCRNKIPFFLHYTIILQVYYARIAGSI